MNRCGKGVINLVKGLLITFEGIEGGGKTTQIGMVAEKLQRMGRVCRRVREPGGTAIGEEIRHTLKHSEDNRAMFPETELLLMSASRAQLVREVIGPALSRGEIVLCDRYLDSTIAYQGYGRGLDLGVLGAIVAFAVGDKGPDLTLLFAVTLEKSEERRLAREREGGRVRDRMEEADRSFFQRVAEGYEKMALAEPERFRRVDANRGLEEVSAEVWACIEPLVRAHGP